MSDWRYLAQDALTKEWLHRDLPLVDVEIEHALSSPPGLTATITPEAASLRRPDGRLVLEEWGTKIFAEQGGTIRGGGILVHSGLNDEGQSWEVDAPGLSYYPKGIPYGDEFVQWAPDPLDVFRRIWDHLQAQPDGNLGILIDGLKSGAIVGDVQPPPEPVEPGGDPGKAPVKTKSMTTAEYDKLHDTWRKKKDAYEARMDVYRDQDQVWRDAYGDRQPYSLVWWEYPDCGSEIDNLSAEGPFDWQETHSWVGDDVETRIRLGYPRLGTRRTNLRFVEGENVAVVPDIERDGDEYANQIITLGSGEGRDTRRATAGGRDGRVRRVRVVPAKDVSDQARLHSIAQQEFEKRRALDNTDELVVWNHPNAPLGSFDVGDEIPVVIRSGWATGTEFWARIIGIRFRPDDEDTITLQVIRAERA